MGEKPADNGCARCGAVPVVEDGLCQDCIELEDDFDDEDDYDDDFFDDEDEEDEDDDGPDEAEDF